MENINNSRRMIMTYPRRTYIQCYQLYFQAFLCEGISQLHKIQYMEIIIQKGCVWTIPIGITIRDA